MRLRTFSVIVVWAAICAPASAQTFTGWDGTNPFNCELQQAGFEATGPDPTADPYCVQFDKTRQNVTELGVVDFLAKEPGRLTAPGDKCFYFQSDHWRGSVVQDDGSTKTYEWVGHYVIDRARGQIGGWITNGNVNGYTYDFSAMPGVPDDFRRHMGPGTVGGILTTGIPIDPRCAQRAASEPIYASSSSSARSGCGPSGFLRCAVVGRAVKPGLVR